MANGPLKVKLEVGKKRGEWAAVAVFAGPVAAEVKGSGTTVPGALRVLADAIELYFEHVPETDDR